MNTESKNRINKKHVDYLDADGKQVGSFETVYDHAGNIVSESLEDQNPNECWDTQYTYKDGRLAESVHHYMNEWDYGVDAECSRASSVTKYEYDASGNLILETAYDDEGEEIHRCEMKYDDLGRIMEKVTYVQDDLSGKETWSYDEKMMHMVSDYISGEESIRHYYDSEGNPLKEIIYDQDEPEEYSYEYDERGNRTKTWSRSGLGDYLMNESKYDAEGKEISFYCYDRDGAVNLWRQFEYDGSGKRIKETTYNPDESIEDITEHEYDGSGDEIRETTHYPINEKRDRYHKEEYYFPKCEYDESGNLIRKTFFNSDGSVKCSDEYKYYYDT